MKQFIPYLNFAGNCREAMSFYGKVFKTNVDLMTFGDSGQDTKPEYRNRIMHSSMQMGSAQLFASDVFDEMGVRTGDNIWVYVNCDSKEEVDNALAGLAQGGKIRMPAADTFWGSYFGTVSDQFKINWMLGFDAPKKN